MGSSGKAFDEVKAILGKLDRSIDQARTKRLGPEDEPESGPTSENAGGGDSSEQLIGVPSEQRSSKPTERAPIPGEAPQRSRAASEYGRARPLRGNEAAPTGQWDRAKAAKPAERSNQDDDLIG